jgi:hypothetical protein
MRKKEVIRVITLVSGLLAVGVILLSSSFGKISADQKVAKTKTEQESTDQHTFISAPAEAIPSAAVKLTEDSDPSLLEILFTNTEEENELPTPVVKELVRYFKVLFRAFVSPNAP